MVVVYRGYDQHAGLRTKHGGGECGVRGYNISLQTPSYCERLVTPSDDTGQLGKISLVDRFLPKGERNDLR